MRMIISVTKQTLLVIVLFVKPYHLSIEILYNFEIPLALGQNKLVTG